MFVEKHLSDYIKSINAGGDGAIGFAVRKPDGKIVHPYAWKATTEYEEQHAAGGYYSFCLDNQGTNSIDFFCSRLFVES